MHTPSRAFGIGETHGILWRPENRIHAASEGRGWTSLYASAQRETPYAATYGAVQDHLIILHIDGPVGVSRIIGKNYERRTVAPGGLFILPGSVDFSVHLEGGLESLHVYLRQTMLHEVAAELIPGDPAHIEIVPRLGDQDSLIEHLALGVRDALTDPDPSTPVYADYLARAFAARLLRAHSNRSHLLVNAQSGERPQSRGGLTRAQLARAVECMEASLSASLSLMDLATATGLSPAHFARRFKASTGLPPHQYLMRLRLERAKRLLCESDLSLAQIAFECGFSHQEHMTRLFGRLTGTTPGALRRAAGS